MLQFIADKSNNFTIAEQINMAINGGCTWVQLHLPDCDDAQIKSIASEIIPICREAGIILTIEDRPDLAQELGLHGVHITTPGANARQIRQDLGAEAIIGINVSSAQGVPTLEKLDIDYVTIAPEISTEQAKDIVKTVRSVGCVIPIVLTGNYNCLDINIIRQTGVDGVATGSKLMQADNPTDAISQLLTALKQ